MPNPEEFTAALSDALDEIDDSIAVLDHDGRFVFVNAVTLKIIGKPRGEILGKTYREVFGDLIPDHVVAALRHAIAKQGKTIYEHFHEPNGRWYRLALVPTSRTVTVHGTDITETKTAQELSRRLTRTLNRLGDPIVMIGRDWRYLFVNDAAVAHLDSPRKSIIGQNIWELLPHLATSSFGQAYRQAMKSTDPFTLEDYYPARDGWFRADFFPGPDGITVHIINVTDFKRSQQQVTKLITVKTSEAELFQAFSTLPTPVMVVGSDMRYLFYNEAALEPNHRRLTDVVGKTPWEVNPYLDQQFITKHFNQAKRAGRSSYELKLPPTNRWFHFEVVSWQDKVIVNAIETTRLKQSERSVKILTNSLQQALDNSWNRKDARDTGPGSIPLNHE